LSSALLGAAAVLMALMMVALMAFNPRDYAALRNRAPLRLSSSSYGKESRFVQAVERVMEPAHKVAGTKVDGVADSSTVATLRELIAMSR
jgi:hypothetical protein